MSERKANVTGEPDSKLKVFSDGKTASGYPNGWIGQKSSAQRLPEKRPSRRPFRAISVAIGKKKDVSGLWMAHTYLKLVHVQWLTLSSLNVNTSKADFLPEWREAVASRSRYGLTDRIRVQITMSRSTTSTTTQIISKYSRAYSTTTTASQNPGGEWQHFSNPVLKVVLDVKHSEAGDRLESFRLRVLWNMGVEGDAMDVDQREFIFVRASFLLMVYNLTDGVLYRKT